ncbi:hypothetical protein [Cellulomonas cellasea]|uniref:ABC transporter permease n=1 Tax=Cellulomonas cellasea TaxID=43670 RepID=A0A7W4UGH7_9CELL|nr:hypothetical protein [Cellulomonas cellasea]MBB2923732.1 hypothetical protein [Cellulomonas cellasea]
MRAAGILGEAYRNVATRTTRATMFALTLGLTVAAACLLDTLTTIALQERAAAWDASGAAVHVLAAEQGIDGASCAALPRAHGDTRRPVVSAGAITAGPTLTFDATAASSLPSFVVTPSLADVLGVRAATEGVWISDQLAATLAAAVGDRLGTDRGPLTVAGVFPWPDDGRDQRLAYAVLVPSATHARYDECWATITPSNAAATDLLRTAGVVTPQATRSAPVALLNNTLGQELDAWAQYQGRTSRYVGLLVPLLGLVLGYVATRLRRLEYASALHAGVRRRDLVATATVETLAWVVPAVAAATAAVALTALRLTDPANAVDLVAGQVPALLAALVTAPLGVVAALTLTHEHHLFAYFKER